MVTISASLSLVHSGGIVTAAIVQVLNILPMKSTCAHNHTIHFVQNCKKY